METFSKAQAWIDLILNANHKDNKMSIRGNVIDVNRGQIGWSELTMMARWKWSRNKVRGFLLLLEKQEQIVQQKTSLTTVITILYYDQYQYEGTAEGTAEGQQKVQQKDSRRYTNKNVKNVKNVKKEEKVLHFEFIYLLPKELEQLKKKWPTSYEQKIKELNEYGHTHPKRFKEYGCHYRVILKWNKDTPADAQINRTSEKPTVPNYNTPETKEIAKAITTLGRLLVSKDPEKRKRAQVQIKFKGDKIKQLLLAEKNRREGEKTDE